MLILKYYFFVNKTNYSPQLPNRGFNHKIKNSTIRYPMRLQCRNCLHEMWEDVNPTRQDGKECSRETE